MVRTPPFQILHDLAKKAMDRALTEIGNAVSHALSVEQQLIVLQNYRHDYLCRLQTSMAVGIRSSQCRNAQNFNTMLDETISRQAGLLGQAQKQVELARARYLEERRKMTSMSALLDRTKQKQHVIHARREQKFSDEYAARSYARTRAVQD